MSRPRTRRGFTLLEVLVATLIMGIAVSGILSGLSAASRNAARLTEYDRATLLAKQKMDDLLADDTVQPGQQMEAVFDPALAGGVTCGWRARITPFETVPGAVPGFWVVNRIELEIWWMSGATRRTLTLEGFRRGLLAGGPRP